LTPTTLYYTVCGILNIPGEVKGWDIQAQEYIRAATGEDAAGYNYGGGWIGEMVWINGQAKRIAQDLYEANGEYDRIVYIGHSNGGRLFTRMLKVSPYVRKVTAHLFASAEVCDCEENGLNDAARRGQLDHLYIYISSGDHVLASPVAYGQMGLRGPTNMCPELAAIVTICEPARLPCDHGDWIGRDFEASMDRVIGGSK
jgi:hypothetical protein